MHAGDKPNKCIECDILFLNFVILSTQRRRPPPPPNKHTEFDFSSSQKDKLQLKH